MGYNIKIEKEPLVICKTYSGEVEVHGTLLQFYIDDCDNGTLSVDFIDEILLDKTLLEHEKEELISKIKDSYGNKN